MALRVRDLLPKVQPMRKDIEEERSIFAIQESVRKICRQTMLAQEKLSNISAPSNPVTLVPTTGYTVNRVSLVRLLDVQGNWRVLNEYNEQAINNVYEYPDLPAGIPNGYTYLGNSQIKLYPYPEGVSVKNLVAGRTYNILTVGTTNFTLIGASANTVGVQFTATAAGTGTGTVTQMLEVTVSEIPTGEIDTIPLPDEAEDCIVAGALATILMLPGPGQNLQLSKDREVLHNRELGNLKAIALFAQSGRDRVMGRVLGGRQRALFDSGRTF
jgi:hypothetical protein